MTGTGQNDRQSGSITDQYSRGRCHFLLLVDENRPTFPLNGQNRK